MKYNIFNLLTILLIVSNLNTGFSQKINVVQYVDPYIGTGDHGHVFLGGECSIWCCSGWAR